MIVKDLLLAARFEDAVSFEDAPSVNAVQGKRPSEMPAYIEQGPSLYTGCTLCNCDCSAKAEGYADSRYRKRYHRAKIVSPLVKVLRCPRQSDAQ